MRIPAGRPRIRGEIKRAAVAFPAFRPNLSAHQFHQIFGYGESQARAAGFGWMGLDLFEAFEYLFQGIGRDADARIAHAEKQQYAADGPISPSRSTEIAIPPSVVNLTAFPSRLVITWRNRPGSPDRLSGTSRSMRKSKARLFSRMASRNGSNAVSKNSRNEKFVSQFDLSGLDFGQVQNVVDDVQKVQSRTP